MLFFFLSEQYTESKKTGTNLTIGVQTQGGEMCDLNKMRLLGCQSDLLC